MGRGRRLEAVERLAGGLEEGRVPADDATTAIAYRWAASENYWPAAEGDGDLADPFSAGVGFDLFEAAHARLASSASGSPRSTWSTVPPSWRSWRTSLAGT